jgi:hypothetical protein
LIHEEDSESESSPKSLNKASYKRKSGIITASIKNENIEGNRTQENNNLKSISPSGYSGQGSTSEDSNIALKIARQI